MKVGVLPDRVLMSLMNDRMIAKGTILDFITAFFKDYLATDSMDDLVQLLRKARLDDRLLDFFPPQRRNLTDFDAHFKASPADSTCTCASMRHLHSVVKLLWSNCYETNQSCPAGSLLPAKPVSHSPDLLAWPWLMISSALHGCIFCIVLAAWLRQTRMSFEEGAYMVAGPDKWRQLV